MNIDIIDISAEALRHTRGCLKDYQSIVSFHCGDITNYIFENKSFDLWHDRAVFHFLTEQKDREAYRDTLKTNYNCKNKW